MVKRVRVGADKLKPSEHRHGPFGPEYDQFFGRMARVFGDVVPGTRQEWEDDFRRDANPEREMAIWTKMADCYEQVTVAVGEWPLDKRKGLFSFVLACVSYGVEAATAEEHTNLTDDDIIRILKILAGEA